MIPAPGRNNSLADLASSYAWTEPRTPNSNGGAGAAAAQGLVSLVHAGRVNSGLDGGLRPVHPAMTEGVLDFGSAYSRKVQLWDRLAASRPAANDPHFRMAQIVFAAVLGADGARLVTGGVGACRITDSRHLSAATGLEPNVWLKAPAGFRQGGVLFAPWPVTLEIVSAAARVHEPRLRVLVGRETQAQHLCCQHGNASALPGEAARRYCCKCEFGLRKGPALPHEDSFYCADCAIFHPGSRMLDGCPTWWQYRTQPSTED